MGLLIPLAKHKKSHCDGSIVIFDGCWGEKNTNELVYYGLEFGKNLARPIFIFGAMSLDGYYNEFIVV